MADHYRLAIVPLAIRNIAPAPAVRLDNAAIVLRYPALVRRSAEECLCVYQGEINREKVGSYGWQVGVHFLQMQVEVVVTELLQSRPLVDGGTVLNDDDMAAQMFAQVPNKIVYLIA
jgi:hypothetical protein